ncbi:MAG TPA: four-carbon acid sugar kinase family protein [Rubrobacter sp.]|nr:four-carbon acid sugar kinase family protein [Rubrobacter sp.]
MLTAIIADDLTGAADTGVQFARAGYRAAVVFRGEPVPSEDLDAVVFDTDSRTLRPGLATRYVAEAGRAARAAPLVYKKFDSTLRGSVAAELSATFETTRRRRAVVAPAFPAAGRTTTGGTQLVHGVPVHETEMRNDPRTPVREGHVPTLLGRWSSSVGTLSVEDLEDPENVRRALEGYEWTVVDAGRDADLEALVRAVPDPDSVLWAGSAGLALALGAVYPGPRVVEQRASFARASSVLVVVGSLNAASRGQLDKVVERYGEVAVSVGPGSAGTVGDVVEKARGILSRGPCAVVHSSGRASSADRGRVMRSLAEAAAALGEEGLFDGLVLTGGSTAVAVSRALGASGIRLAGELEAGVPVGALICPSPHTVVTKAGGFGGPDTLVGAVESLLKGDGEK